MTNYCTSCWKLPVERTVTDPDYGTEYGYCFTCAYKAGFVSQEEWDASILEILTRSN